jgi:hypothetical protein
VDDALRGLGQRRAANAPAAPLAPALRFHRIRGPLAPAPLGESALFFPLIGPGLGLLLDRVAAPLPPGVRNARSSLCW